MDPNAALASLREALADYTKADEVQEHFDALDDWLSKGGFPPDAWNSTPRSGDRMAVLAEYHVVQTEYGQYLLRGTASIWRWVGEQPTLADVVQAAFADHLSRQS